MAGENDAAPTRQRDAFVRIVRLPGFFGGRPPSRPFEGKVVSRIFASWNQLDGWLRAVDGLRQVA
jgi:hypothetical protein